MIDLSNLNGLIVRIYDLLHKAQRTIHLNTLEALNAMVSRYPSQFQQHAPNIMREVTPFITDLDLQAATLALKVATNCISLNN